MIGTHNSIYAFYRLQNKFIENSNILRKLSGSFNVCLTFPEKWFSIRLANFHFKAFYQHSIAQEIRFRLLADFRTGLQETPTWRENLRKVSKPASLSQKNGLVFVELIWHYKDLNQYSMVQKIRFTLFPDFKTNLQENTIYRKSFREVYQKNSFVFVQQILHFKAFYQHSVTQKFRFRLLTDFRRSLQEIPTWRENLHKVSKPASLSQKNGFLFVQQVFILKPFTNNQLHRRFDLGFWQTSEQAYRKFQHGEKIFAKFQSQPRFPRKMVWYSLS